MIAVPATSPASGHEDIPPLPRSAGTFRHEVVEQIPGTVASVLPGRVPAVFLRVETLSGRLVLHGTEGEPFVRFSGGAVEVNHASPTWELTARGRGGYEAEAPVGAGTEPRWHVEGSAPQLTWLEPRAVPRRDGRDFDWSVPGRLDGRPVSLRGRSVWVPRPGQGVSGDGWKFAAAGGSAVLAVVGAALLLRRIRHAPAEDGGG